MNLMNKYLGIMKHNKEYIVNIDTDTNIPEAISHKPIVKDLNKKVFTAVGRINAKIKYDKTPDKSDKTPLNEERLQIIRRAVSDQPFQQWDSEMQKLINWYKTTPKPSDAFCLDACRRVICPEKFFDNIDHRIDAGPTRLEYRNGNLKEALLLLKKCLIMGGESCEKQQQ